MRYLAISLILCMMLPVAACSQEVGGRPQAVEDTLQTEVEGLSVQPWVSGLEVPWSLVFLPDGRALVSERPGRIRLIRDGRLEQKPFAELDVHDRGEGGLMGLALHPGFPEQPWVYAMYTHADERGIRNRVVRLRDMGKTGRLDRVIIDDIPGASLHNGGRIAFGPDGMLYVTCGENFQGSLAQDLDTLAGKILRATPEGRVPSDNPFGTLIWSYGHRNPQGLAWDPRTGLLLSSEHGPSGEMGRFANDEINLIRKGENYGWPKVIGAPGQNPYVDPLIVWKDTTPPAGMTFYQGDLLGQFAHDLFVASLRSRALLKIRLEPRGEGYRIVDIQRWFARGMESGIYGRIRDVAVGPDQALYFLTSNRDGRGDPRPGDDHIYRIAPR